MPGRAGAPGWATQGAPCTVPCSSPSVAPARTGTAAEIRISSLAWDSGWFCPRTSSAVIAVAPCVVLSYAACPSERGSYRCGRIAGIRSWKVRPLAGVPKAVIAQPEPDRCTLAMIWAVYSPPPLSV